MRGGCEGPIQQERKQGGKTFKEMAYKGVNYDYQLEEKKSLSEQVKDKIYERIHILNWITKYRKKDAIGDAIAGITVGLTLMPQSIAYASLAGLSPQFGLYSAFLGGYLYVIFGTVKEVSIGPTAVMSLLTYEFTHGLRIEYMALLTFLAGCIELLMGLLNLGFLIDFISTPVTSGFTSAYSVIIIASQIKSLLGLRKFKTKGFVDNITKLTQHVHETRLWDTLLGVACIALLLTLRKVKDIPVGSTNGKHLTNRQKKIKKTLWFISISRNAVTVLLSGLIAYWFESYGMNPFVLSGKVEKGLPTFDLPSFSLQEGNSTITFTDMCSELGVSILIIPVVAVLANVAIAKAFSTGASINATQEMITLGLCNMFGSCVHSLPTCGAFTRSAVSNASGVRTPMMSIYSATLIVLALNLLTPCFYYIPRATLAAVLISAVFFMIDWEIIKPAWRANKKDLFLVVVTFVSCLTLDVEVGLLIGIVTNACFLIYMWARPAINITSNKTPCGTEYLMVTPDFGLLYPATEYFSSIVRTAGLNSAVIINCENFKAMDYTTAKIFNVLHQTFIKKQQSIILYKVKPEIAVVFVNAGVTIPCCQTEEDIVEILCKGKVDFIKSEMIPLIEKKLKEHSVLVENVPANSTNEDTEACVPYSHEQTYQPKVVHQE